MKDAWRIKMQDKDAGRLLFKYIYLSLYCKGSKGLLKDCMWEDAGDRKKTSYFDPTVMTVTLCLSCSLRWSTRGLGVYSVGAFPRAPSVWCGLSYHISSLNLWESSGNCFGGFPSAPSVGCGLPYHIWSLGVWNSTGNCIGGFRGPPRSGVIFPTTSCL